MGGRVTLQQPSKLFSTMAGFVKNKVVSGGANNNGTQTIRGNNLGGGYEMPSFQGL